MYWDVVQTLLTYCDIDRLTCCDTVTVMDGNWETDFDVEVIH